MREPGEQKPQQALAHRMPSFTAAIVRCNGMETLRHGRALSTEQRAARARFVESSDDIDD